MGSISDIDLRNRMLNSAENILSELFSVPKLGLDWSFCSEPREIPGLEKDTSFIYPSNILSVSGKHHLLSSKVEPTEKEVFNEVLHAYHEHYNPSVSQLRQVVKCLESNIYTPAAAFSQNDSSSNEEAAKIWVSYLNAGLVFLVSYSALGTSLEEYMHVRKGRKPNPPEIEFHFEPITEKMEEEYEMPLGIECLIEALSEQKSRDHVYFSVGELSKPDIDLTEVLTAKMVRACTIGMIFGLRLFWENSDCIKPKLRDISDKGSRKYSVVFPYPEKSMESVNGALVGYFKKDIQDLAIIANKAVQAERGKIFQVATQG